jgi:hypothetical protein
MTQPARLVVTIGVNGSVTAETQDVLGARCLDYISILEDLLEAETVASRYTADYARNGVGVVNEEAQNELGGS